MSEPDQADEPTKGDLSEIVGNLTVAEEYQHKPPLRQTSLRMGQPAIQGHKSGAIFRSREQWSRAEEPIRRAAEWRTMCEDLAPWLKGGNRHCRSLEATQHIHTSISIMPATFSHDCRTMIVERSAPFEVNCMADLPAAWPQLHTQSS